MKHSGKVLIEKNTDSTKRTAESIRKNMYAVTNVNVPQGPRTGNPGAHDGKRTVFAAQKEERAPLATMIERAYGTRGEDNKDTVKPGLEPISASSKRKFKK